eukprot:ctg_1627.g612
MRGGCRRGHPGGSRWRRLGPIPERIRSPRRAPSQRLTCSGNNCFGDDRRLPHGAARPEENLVAAGAARHLPRSFCRVHRTRQGPSGRRLQLRWECRGERGEALTQKHTEESSGRDRGRGGGCRQSEGHPRLVEDCDNSHFGWPAASPQERRRHRVPQKIGACPGVVFRDDSTHHESNDHFQTLSIGRSLSHAVLRTWTGHAPIVAHRIPHVRSPLAPRIPHGAHEADGAQVDGRQGAAQAAGHQGGAQVGAVRWRREEAPPVPPGHGGAAGDPPLPEVDRAAHPQAAVPAPGARNRPGLQDRPALPVVGGAGAAGGLRGLPGEPVRGHQPLRHPRQARHHHAQGYTARP